MKIHTKHLLQIGLTTNIFEWYEFLVFAYLAKVIGQVFFSTTVPGLAIINTFAVFAVSYLIRPIGSLFFGYIGDKYSPEKIIKYSIVLMAIPTAFIGILPTYQQVGILSPIILTILRLIQGFASGGELPGSASYIYNKSLSHPNSSLLCCLPSIGSVSGSLLASFVIYLLYKLFNYTVIIEWAWRMPFLLSIPLLFFIFKIRNNIPQTQAQSKTIADKLTLKKHLLMFITAFMLTAFLQVSFYLALVWMPIYLSTFIHISAQIASFANILALISTILSTLLFAYIAKHLSYKTLLRTGIITITIFIYPLLTYIGSNLLTVISFQIFLGISIGCIDGVYFFTMARLFPFNIRNRGVAITFTCASAFLGGTSPLICSYVINQFHYASFPAIYILVLGLLAFIFSWTI